MQKARTRADDHQLRKLAKRYGVNTLRRWRYDERLAWVMSLADYVRMFGTHVGYRPFVRVDESMLFVQMLPSLPSWLSREAPNA
jgi:hypothetical protein